MSSSGTLNTSTVGARQWYYEISWSISSQSVANNTSTISWNVYVRSGGGGTSVSGWTSCDINVGGSAYTILEYGSRTLYPGQNIGNGSTTVTHESDGSKTLSISASGKFMGSDCSGSWSWALTVIPRASVPTCTNPTLSSTASMIISTNRKSTSFTHTIVISFGETSYTQTGVTDSYTYTIPVSDWLAEMPNNATKTGTITCKTYNGTTKIGDDKTCSFTATVDSAVWKPVINTMTIQDSNPTSAQYTSAGMIVRYISILHMTGSITHSDSNVGSISNVLISSPSGGSSTSITPTGASYSVNFTAENPITASLTITATDSRGIQAVATITWNLIAYVYPTVTLTVGRVEPTTGKVYLQATGTWYNGNIGTTANTFQTAVTYQGVTDSSSGTDAVVLTKTLNDNIYTIPSTTLVNTYDYQKQYDITLTVRDLFSNGNDTKRVFFGIPSYSWGEDSFSVFGNLLLYKDRSNPTEYMSLLDYCHPVGSYYMSDSSTSPASLFGGTWIEINGYTLAGINKSDTDTNVKTSFNQSAGTLIGSKYLQSHRHSVATWKYYANTPQTGTKIAKTYDSADGNSTATYTGLEGSGDAQNIQPTRLTYIWQRTA